MSPDLFLGIDLGTSGCRIIAINERGEIQGRSHVPLPPPRRQGMAIEQNPAQWWQAIKQALTSLFQTVPAKAVRSLAVDGTSGTVVLVDRNGNPLTPALLYNDSRSHAEARLIAEQALPHSGALGPTSSLAKLLYLQSCPEALQAAYLLHQADWIAFRLGAKLGISDENNCLKTGYDSIRQEWPDWLSRVGVRRELLPAVVPPGALIGTIDPSHTETFQISPQAKLVAGTTDSIAAFIATGAEKPGDAVTSLGSTLALKVASEHPIFSAKHGIYSHRLGKLWLAGGASNSGGVVLRQHFTQAQLDKMTPHLQPQQTTGLNYYPLPAQGERFPIPDPHYSPRLTPRPLDNVTFFQAILEGIARIEAQGYRQLQLLGAPFPSLVKTTGGGARNPAWLQIREQTLRVPVITACETEAAYGSALLARQALS
ncbi:FGGY-family carbohydrate kinase [Nitrosococcus watsonii]|uniref:Carbohydrate kinase, FGGY-like protein n=1 Tax=Nitrosococcus watsoni (strain C-113) TaxID=105559 RepID=D8K612_NITWC|nr:FGGY-family carbohydrate kinase [Nitrosococcus watsonii]ADJ28339.1 Carbohydrate kinase, FGGY-like protein [Nitrosococcus watsonii C-113]